MAAASPYALVDANRLEQMMFVGRSRGLFLGRDVIDDADGLSWAVKQHDNQWYGICGLGPGWIFDQYAATRRADELAEAKKQFSSLDTGQITAKLDTIISHTKFGKLIERLFWCVHRRVLEAKQSTVMLPDFVVARHLWGQESQAPAHWRQNVMVALRSLAQLHLATAKQDEPPLFGMTTALLTHAADLRRSSNDHCPPDCPAHGGQAHTHFLVNIGRGFLGILEQCADDADEVGIRQYNFPARKTRNTTGPTLKKLGRTGTLVSLYLPARLGEPAKCDELSHQQHRLLQAIVRERTRRPRERRKESAETEVIVGNNVQNAQGRALIACPLLDPSSEHVGFNGNGNRRGCGYKLLSEGGWLSKAGYASQDAVNFLADLVDLSRRLGLVVVGLLPGTNPLEWLDLPRMLEIARQQRISLLERLNLRIYTAPDYEEHWNRTFGWPFPSAIGLSQADDDVQQVNQLISEHGIPAARLAEGIGMDPSLLCKIRNGKRRCPHDFLNRVQDFMRDRDAETVIERDSPNPASPTHSFINPAVNLQHAIDYAQRGWSVIPQIPGKKRPCVKWKRFQTRQPTEDDLRQWWTNWPYAGIALIAGELSNVMVIDVDGTEAHEELLSRLGSEPIAPKAISGSHDPNRYHLFFQHPSIPTRAKQTPWHPKLEFRGNGGLAILPPSLHKSGNRYAWAHDRSLADLALPTLPPAIVEALQIPVVTNPPPAAERIQITISDTSASTQEFLRGTCANGPRWNDRLFAAACDLAGRGVPICVAEPVLMSAAQPWDAGEQESARRTIESAYSQPLMPGVR